MAHNSFPDHVQLKIEGSRFFSTALGKHCRRVKGIPSTFISIVMESPSAAVYLQDLQSEIPDGIPAISEDERAFLDAVREGDISAARSYILKKRVDINCASLLGETALQIAVSYDHPEMAKFLLQNGADMGTAVLQAVNKNAINCVKTLLEFVDDRRQNETNSSSDDLRVEYRKYISPLMLAAENDNREMIKLLLSYGYTIPDPPQHDRSCDCEECLSLGQRFGTSLFRLHTYSALASPVYLCLSYLYALSESSKSGTSEDYDINTSKDPIIRAFLLNKKLEMLMETEYEFRSDYKKLSNRCEEFAVSILTECRSMEEIGCVMSVPGIDKLHHMAVSGGRGAQKLSVLNFAIANKNEKFVAHPYSQLMLNSVLYEGCGGWESLRFPTKLLFGLLFGILLPLLAFLYLVAPNCRVSLSLRKPLFKFCSHSSSFCWFLMLLVLSSLQDKFVNVLQFSGFDIFLALWIAGMLFEEAKELYRQGKERYFSQFWNIVSLSMLSLFVLSGAFWLTGYVSVVNDTGIWSVPIQAVFGRRAEESAYRLILVSNGLFALGLVLSFFQASNLFQVSSVLGPLQLSLINMMRDIAKFLFLFLLLYLAFGWAERKVYSQYVQAREAFVGNATEHGFARIAGALRFLFWDLFGLSELEELETDENFIITQYTGEILLALYSIASIVVAINMLIAMMSNSYQRVADDADIQWKFSRTRMWMQYVDSGSVMPPPFNLIPPPHLLIRYARRLFAGPVTGVCCRQDRQSQSTRLEGNVDLQRRTNIMRRLIDRYLFTLEKSGTQSQRSSESQADLSQLRELIAQMRVLLQQRNGRKSVPGTEHEKTHL